MSGKRPDFLPDFLIVGAMKGGTTTLYYDLGLHPDFHLPENKEPDILVANTEAQAIRDAYALHFRAARPGQRCGEASTAYTKRPDHEGLAERARAALGPDLRIVYITRDPVARALSHYRHDRQHEKVAEPFDEAVRRHARYTDYGRYAWQIAPWREAFGEDAVRVIRLEDYAADRETQLADLVRFLGADPGRLGTIDTGAVANSAAEQKTIGNPVLRAIIFSDFYQKRIKPLFPRSLREAVRRTVLPPPAREEIAVTPETRAFIEARTAPETQAA